jgi:hypothetical protein
MLLDDFMAGLLNDLFVQKFYGRSPQLIHYLMRVIDLVCIVCEYLLALWLRENPGQVLDPPDGHFLNLLPYGTTPIRQDRTTLTTLYSLPDI